MSRVYHIPINADLFDIIVPEDAPVLDRIEIANALADLLQIFLEVEYTIKMSGVTPVSCKGRHSAHLKDFL